ncbi:hypothetical protein HDV04_001205 [Boothiomyces sp. JEL0838]|nr:hypothetical protein HDV04_001205 [Boothiomyces sp. JEL0838]
MGLAGPRQKQRITVDPRNKSWTEDKGAIGFKMLEKMGWSEGKGLGSDETGRQTNIKVSLKTNNWGIGADAKTSDNWLENTFALDDMFKNMSSDQVFIMPEPETKEAPVISSRHLKRAKFVKNKIVSNFDSGSINNIFGKKRDGEKLVVEKEKEAQDQPLHIVDGLQTVSTGTDIKDYFAQKMASKGINFQSLLSGKDIPSLAQDSPVTSEKKESLEEVSEESVEKKSTDKKSKKKSKESKEKSKDKSKKKEKKEKLRKVKGDKVSKKSKKEKKRWLNVKRNLLTQKRLVTLCAPVNINDVQKVFETLTDKFAPVHLKSIPWLGYITSAAVKRIPVIIIATEHQEEEPIFIHLDTSMVVSDEVKLGKPCTFEIAVGLKLIRFSCPTSLEYQDWMDALQLAYDLVFVNAPQPKNSSSWIKDLPEVHNTFTKKKLPDIPTVATSSNNTDRSVYRNPKYNMNPNSPYVSTPIADDDSFYFQSVEGPFPSIKDDYF